MQRLQALLIQLISLFTYLTISFGYKRNLQESVPKTIVIPVNEAQPSVTEDTINNNGIVTGAFQNIVFQEFTTDLTYDGSVESDPTDLTLVFVAESSDSALIQPQIETITITNVNNFEIKTIDLTTSTTEIVEITTIFQTLTSLSVESVETMVTLQNFELKNTTPIVSITGAVDGELGLEISNFKAMSNTQQDEKKAIFEIYEIHSTFIMQDGEVLDTTGGGFYIENCKHIEISNMDFYNNNNENLKGGALSFGKSVSDLTIQSSVFYNNFGGDQGGGAIYIDKGKTINIREQTKFIKNRTTQNGAAIYANGEMNMTIDRVHFLKNVSTEGNGVFFIKSFQNIAMTHTEFKNNDIFINGGGLMLDSCDFFDGEYLLFESNQAKNAGGIYIQNTNNIKLRDTLITKGFVRDSGGGLYLTKLVRSRFYNVTISHNSGTMAAAIKQSSLQDFIYDRMIIEHNFATKDGGGINDQSGENGEISYSRFYNNTSETTFAGAMYLKNSQHLEIHHTDYIENRCNINGGALWLESSAHLTLSYVRFERCVAKVNLGGSILNLGTNNILFDHCEFIDGLSYKSGGISFKSSDTNVVIRDSRFERCVSESIGGAIDLETSIVTIERTEFIDNTAEEGGGAIHISKSNALTIIDSTFKGNTAPEGGAIKLIDGVDVQFTGVTIEANHSELGGGIYLLNYITVLFQGTTIKRNYCNDMGGGMNVVNVAQHVRFVNSDIDENYVDFDSRDSIAGGMYMTEVNSLVFEGTTIQNNRAYTKGGALYLTKINGFNMSGCTVESNYVEFDQSRQKNDKGYGYFISMGGAIYYKSQIMKDGEDNDIVQNIEMIGNNFRNNSASSGSALFLYHSKDSELSVVNFSENVMNQEHADVGLVRYLGGQPDQFKNKLKNLNNQNSMLYIHKEEVVTNYIENERRLNDDTYEFELCLFGTSLKVGGETNCDKCHDFGICEGGYKDNYPQKKYWRENKNSWEYIYCKTNPDLCLGNDECEPGYKGILCEECDYLNDYSRTATGTCDICPSGTIIGVLISIVFILYLLLIKMTSLKVMQRVQQNVIKKYLAKMWGKIIKFSNQSSPITKIVIMHVQILYLIKPFNIEFPSFIQGFSTSLANPGTSIALPTICLNPVQYEKQELSIRFDQSRLSYLFSFAIWITLLFITFLSYIRNLKHNKKQLVTQLISISIVFFITQQVGLIEENMKFLICRKIGSKSYTIVDTHVDCNTDYFNNDVLPFNLSALLLLLLVIPGFLFFVIYKNKNYQQNYDVQLKYGYLFIEFKDHCFYWEFLTMFQKALIALTSIIFFEEMIMKSLISVFIIAIYSTMCFMVQPFQFLQLNKLTQLSTSCQIITLFASIMLYGLDGTNSLGLLNFLCVVAILMTNIVFLLYAANMVIPFMGTGLKVRIIDKYDKLPKFFIFKNLKTRFDKKEKAKDHWKILSKHIRNFINLLKDSDLKKFNKQILFYNNSNQEMIEDLKKGNFKKMNRILFQNSEQEILRQPNLQLETLCNYFDMKRQQGLSFEENVIKHIEQQIITESSMFLESNRSFENKDNGNNNNNNNPKADARGNPLLTSSNGVDQSASGVQLIGNQQQQESFLGTPAVKKPGQNLNNITNNQSSNQITLNNSSFQHYDQIEKEFEDAIPDMEVEVGNDQGRSMRNYDYSANNSAMNSAMNSPKFLNQKDGSSSASKFKYDTKDKDVIKFD